MNIDELKPIFDAFVECDNQVILAVGCLIGLLYGKGVLTKDDLIALKEHLQGVIPQKDQRPSRLSYSPLEILVSALDKFLSGDNKDIRSFLTVIKGGLENNE